MKVCVYAITRNERKFVDSFMESTEGADAVFVTDTGSDDGTPERLKELGAIVSDHRVTWDDWPEVSREIGKEKLPRAWRFEVARNRSLADIPEDFDVCVCLDLDEVLHKGWREHLEKAWRKDTTRLRYRYIWNHKADGSPDVEYSGDKIHMRKDYEWHHPVHEVLRYVGKDREIQTYCEGLVIEHFADRSKSRGQYFPLLEIAVLEDPDDDRNAHYLGREYYFHGQWDKAKKELLRHLSLPRAQWKAERAASMRFLSVCCRNLKDHEESIAWSWRACIEAPDQREGWLSLSQDLHDRKDFLGGYYAATRALNITKRQMIYMTDSSVWGERPYDLAGTCACYVGLLDKSREYIKKAYELAPKDQRIIANYKFVKREKAPGIDSVPCTYHIIWPTVRPNLCKTTIAQWIDRANLRNIKFHIGTNSDEDKSKVLKWNNPLIGNVIAVGHEHIGRVYTINQLGKIIKAEPGDAIIVAADDILPPKNWDTWLYNHFNNFSGCIVPNVVGEDCSPRVVVPILDFGCFIRLNKTIFHPSYKHGHCDVELFDNLLKNKLIKDLRKDGEPSFEHNDWRSDKRTMDAHDEILTALYEKDKAVYAKRNN